MLLQVLTWPVITDEERSGDGVYIFNARTHAILISFSYYLRLLFDICTTLYWISDLQSQVLSGVLNVIEAFECRFADLWFWLAAQVIFPLAELHTRGKGDIQRFPIIEPLLLLVCVRIFYLIP